MINPAKLLVGEIQGGVPVRRRQSVPVRFVIHADAIRAHAKKFINGFRREHGLLHRIRHAVLIIRAFNRNPRTRRGQRDEPVCIERQLLHLAGELRESRHEVVAIFPRHVLDAFLAAATRPAKTIRARARAARTSGRAERNALVKRGRHHREFAEPRMAERDDFIFVHERLRLQIIHHARKSPRPAEQHAPIVAGIRGIK